MTSRQVQEKLYAPKADLAALLIASASLCSR
jgi:hypothetical protein